MYFLMHQLPEELIVHFLNDIDYNIILDEDC